MNKLNKLITRIRESDKATPPKSPAHQGNSSLTSLDTDVNDTNNDQNDGQTAEGFLCPSCMEGFGSAEELQSHYDSYHSDVNLHVCPVCKSKFPTTDQLQIHYASDHTPKVPNNSDLRTLQQEVAELQTILREEKYYSEDLKREVTRLTDSVNRGEEPEENALIKHQLKAFEESRSLLSSEVVLLRNQLAESLDTNSNLKVQKDNLEQKAALMATERADLLATIDEEKSARISLESKVNELQDLKANLDAQLEQRPEADDVHVLRKELVQVQTLMDKMTREREQERDRLEKENGGLRMEVLMLSESVEETKRLLDGAPTADFVYDLRKQLDDSRVNLKQSRSNAEVQMREKEAQMSRVRQLEDIIDAKNVELRDLVQSNVSAFEERDKLKENLVESKSDLENCKENCNRLELKLKEISDSLESREEQFDAERSQMTDFQLSSSAEVAKRDQHIKELKHKVDEVTLNLEEKESQLGSTKKQLSMMKDQFQNHSSEVDDIRSQNRELEIKLENERRSKANCEEKVRKLEADVTRSNEAISKLESERLELYAKIEAGDGVNEAIHQLQQKEAVLTEELSETRTTVAQQAAELAVTKDEHHRCIQESKLQALENQEKISKLEGVLKELEGQLMSEEQRCRELEAVLKSQSEFAITSEAEWSGRRLELEHQLRTSSANVDVKVAELESANERVKRISEELIEAGKNVKILENRLHKEKEGTLLHEQNCQSLQVKVVEYENKLDEKRLKIEKLESSLDASMAEKVELKAKIKLVEDLNSDVKKESEQLKESVNEKQQELNEMEKLVSELKKINEEVRTKLSEVESELAHSLSTNEAKCKSFEDELEALKVVSNKVSSKLQSTESDFAKTRTEFEQLSGEHGAVVRQLETSQNSVMELKEQIKETEEAKIVLEDKVQNLGDELSNTLQELQSFMLQKTSLETELFDKQKALSDLEVLHGSLEQSFEDVTSELIREKEETKLTVDKLRDSIEVLVSQKAEVQSRLSETEDKYKQEVESHEKTRDTVKKKATKLEQQIRDLTSQLAVVQESREGLEQEVENQKTMFDAQVGQLRENLSTMHSDLINHQDKVATLEGRMDELSGDKLELEAKLENALDERRALLERCLSSESECEKLRTLTVELRRKLDDALSALHELGRENQTLQLETAKHVSRKWASDSAVDSCTSCQKIFSVTNRKHHCRNCGNIFCNECSSRNATVAAHKKPVRVCDNCFGELSAM